MKNKIRIGKEENKQAKFTILERNNKTKKHKSIVFDADLKTEDNLLKLIKKLLIEHYTK